MTIIKLTITATLVPEPIDKCEWGTLNPVTGEFRLGIGPPSSPVSVVVTPPFATRRLPPAPETP